MGLFRKATLAQQVQTVGINGKLLLQAVKEIQEGCGQLQQAMKGIEYPVLDGDQPEDLVQHKLREAALNFEDAGKMLRAALPAEMQE